MTEKLLQFGWNDRRLMAYTFYHVYKYNQVFYKKNGEPVQL